MARRLAIATQKGGAGKTTTAANLAAAWGSVGRKVLAIDFDPQFDLTLALGQEPGESTIVEVLEGACELPEVIRATVLENVDLVASRTKLSSIELTLANQVKREEFLASALEDNDGGYDVVIIDCPPNLGLLTINALFAAPEIVVPVSMLDRNAFQGAAQVKNTVELLQARKVSVAITALVRTKVDTRRVAYDTINLALPDLNLPVAETSVPLRADFDNALLGGRPLVSTHPDGAGGWAYRQLAEELDSLRGHLRAVA